MSETSFFSILITAIAAVIMTLIVTIGISSYKTDELRYTNNYEQAQIAGTTSTIWVKIKEKSN